MTYSIVFSSMTGNTAALAGKLHELLPSGSCVYFGEPSREAAETPADILFVGFWTDKGGCDPKTRMFLKMLDKRTLVLFGTAGFGSDPAYFEYILKTAAGEVPVSNTVLPGFLCQGKMKPEVKEKFEAILKADPENEKAKRLLEEYDKAVCHPNEEDFEKLRQWAEKLFF